MLCLENSKQNVKSCRKPETSSIYLHRCLLVVFGVQNLFSTHCTDALFVGTALAVMRTRLVHGTFTNSASGELILSIWIKSCFFWSQSFIFIQLSSTTFCGIPCTVFPCVWSDNSTKFLFTWWWEVVARAPLPLAGELDSALRKHHERYWYQETTVYPSFVHIFNYPKHLHSIVLLGEFLNIGNTLDMVVHLFCFCNCRQSSVIFNSETKCIL